MQSDPEMLSLYAVLFAGKQRAQHQVSKLDSSDTIQEQWQGVVKIVQDSSSAFMYHMENHYCLLFAARSWRMDAGNSVSCELHNGDFCLYYKGILAVNALGLLSDNRHPAGAV